MRFEETEVQRALRGEVRSFAAAEIAPIAGGSNALADALYGG